MSYRTNALSVRIADSITEMIVQQKYRPGDKLPNELELSEELKVSRTTLREALRILATRGLVEVRRGIGTFVTRSQSIHADYDVLKIQNTNVNVKDLYEMRLMIEPQAAYYACLRASDEELDTIFRYGEMDEHMISQRNPQWDEYEQKFHNAVASASHNHQGIILANQSPQVAELTLRDHRLVMQYLRERYPEGAKAAMHLHMINTMRAFSIDVD